MSFKKIAEEDVRFFQSVLSETRVLADLESLHLYGKDETEDLVFPPEVVLKPSSASEISKIMKYCNEKKIPVTPIGARTGLSGGCLSIVGGVGLSMELFNKIVEIDEMNLQVTVESGVITQVLQEEVAKVGLYYPPDPSSRGSCFIGGNLAENSGGPRAVKYGVTKDFVLSLEVVLPNGEIIHTGARTLKNSTGYNLTQLMIGSEGTLGIITKAVLKLVPMPAQSVIDVGSILRRIQSMRGGECDFSCRHNTECIGVYGARCNRLGLAICVRCQLFRSKKMSEHILLIEVDGNHMESLMLDCERISEVVQTMAAAKFSLRMMKHKRHNFGN
jgi:glycolate oxidase